MAVSCSAVIAIDLFFFFLIGIVGEGVALAAACGGSHHAVEKAFS